MAARVSIESTQQNTASPTCELGSVAILDQFDCNRRIESGDVSGRGHNFRLPNVFEQIALRRPVRVFHVIEIHQLHPAGTDRRQCAGHLSTNRADTDHGDAELGKPLGRHQVLLSGKAIIR